MLRRALRPSSSVSSESVQLCADTCSAVRRSACLEQCVSQRAVMGTGVYVHTVELLGSRRGRGLSAGRSAVIAISLNGIESFIAQGI